MQFITKEKSQSRCNVQGVPRFSYELSDFFWRFPNEFAVIQMRYQCKSVEVGNRLVQGRIDRQYGRLRHHSLGIYRAIYLFILGKKPKGLTRPLNKLPLNQKLSGHSCINHMHRQTTHLSNVLHIPNVNQTRLKITY